MEERDFNWVLQLLYSSNCRVPVIDTFVITAGNVVLKYFNKENQQLCRLTNFTAFSVESCIREIRAAQRDETDTKEGRTQLCYSIEQNQRKELDLYCEIGSGAEEHIQVTQLRSPGTVRVFQCKSFYTPAGSKPSLFLVDNGLEEVKLFPAANDLMRVLTRHIEMCSNKRVLCLEVDFIEEADKTL